MKVSKEKLLPLVIGALPVVVVLSLVLFISAAKVPAPSMQPGALQSPAGPGPVSGSSPSPQPGSNPAPSTGGGSSAGSGGGSSPICLPILGCF